MTTGSNIFYRPRPGRWALLLLLVLGLQVHAQDVPNRFLFIFDTSADMKNRLKAEQLEVNQLLATSMGGQLQQGDSLGVWAFDQTLRAGQFPLVTWAPENANDIAKGINTFLHDQHYSQTTSFGALQPVLNEVIQSSPRLTVIIFCDGEENIQWTPYYDGINQLFGQRKDAEAKARQPFILVLRCQLGQYVGSTMNFPPGMLNFPDFPPLPQPAPVVTAPVPVPAPAPPPQTAPPLIIVGTKVMDHEPPLEPISDNVPPPKPTPPPVMTNTVVITNTLVVTNTVAAPENSPLNHNGALALGAGLLIAAAGLITLAVSRSRSSDRSSLITRSMRKD